MPRQLHTFIGSPNGRKVAAVINHLGLAVETVYHDFLAGDLRTPAYRVMNPNSKVPVLQDGGFTLWESTAIMQYLADKAGSDELFPRDPKLRASVVQWQCWEIAHYNRALGTLVFESVIKPKLGIGASDAAVVAISLAELSRYAPVLEGHLARRHHLVADRLTIADYSVAALETYQAAVPFDWAPYPELNAYYERMRKVEAWSRTAAPRDAALGRKPKAA